MVFLDAYSFRMHTRADDYAYEKPGHIACCFVRLAARKLYPDEVTNAISASPSALGVALREGIRQIATSAAPRPILESRY